MCKKLIYFISFVLVLSIAGTAKAELVGWWRFDEGSGTTASDSSGNGNDGTLEGGAQWVAGQLGPALEFNGSGARVVAPYIPLDSRSFTITMWVNPVLYTGEQVVFSTGLTGSNDTDMHFRIYGPDSGRVRMGFYNNDLDTTTTIDQNNWYHLTFWYDFENQNRRIYINGVLEAEGDATPYLGTTGDTVIGAWGTGQLFQGIIDDVQIYNHALTEGEIESAMLGLGGYPYASSPTPNDGTLYADTWVNLSWRPGDYAVSHDVYFGDNFDDVNDGTGGTFQGNQVETSFRIGSAQSPYLVPGTTYYWRVDEFDAIATYKGHVWSFTTEGAVGLGATVNVTDYGAVPNDGNDDVVAIKNAITAATSGDTVFFPAGTYLISDSIAPKSGINLVGSGQNATIIKFIGTTDHSMISIPGGKSDVEISHLTLDANSDPNAQQGILASSGSGHFLHHLTIKNFVDTVGWGPHGIIFSLEVTDSVISENTITNIAPATEWGAGIRLAWGSSRNKVMRNNISDTGRGGILCNDNSTDLVIRNNNVSKSGGRGLGIEVWNGCDRAVIEDNIIDHWLSVDSSSGSAIRRNVVRDKSGIYKFTGLELANSRNCVFTDNVVDDGAHIGMSVSNIMPKEYIYWAYNTIRYCSTWGAQIQGEAGGATYQYFYKNKFLNTYKDHPDALYPNQGHGFRFNGNCHYITLDDNEIRDNGRAGIQLVGTSLDQLSYVNNSITGNGGASITSEPGSDLEWENNTVSGNGSDIQLSSRGFSNQKPTASFNSLSRVRQGDEISFTNTSSDPEGSIGHVLWDFDDDIPSTVMNPTHTYTKPGTYRVSLVVWDNLGRAAQTEKIIVVVSSPTLIKMVVLTGATFDRTVLNSDVPVLVDFLAPWCGPCLTMAPVIQEIADEYAGRAKICKVNVDNAPQTSTNYGVNAIPTFILFKDGVVRRRWLGVTNKNVLTAAIDGLL